MNHETEIFRKLVLPHSEMMRLTCLRVLGDPDDALDALQETLAKLWSRRQELDSIENPGAYFRTTARNVSLSMLRSRRIQEADIDSADEPDYEDNRIADRSTLSVVELLMTRLPEPQSRALRMRCFDDLSIEEISTAMHVTEPNVRQLLSRARKKLKELYTLHLK